MSPASFYLFNMVTTKIKITGTVHIVFVLDSAVLQRIYLEYTGNIILLSYFCQTVDSHPLVNIVMYPYPHPPKKMSTS